MIRIKVNIRWILLRQSPLYWNVTICDGIGPGLIRSYSSINTHQFDPGNMGLSSTTKSNDVLVQEHPDFTRWIRDSVIENIPSHRPTNRTILKVLPKSVPEERSSFSTIFRIPSVDNMTFEIIWKNQFIHDVCEVTDVVIKRLNYRRSIFKVSQLHYLVNSLYQGNRFQYIHELYLAYKNYIFVKQNPLIDDSAKYRTLLNIFIQVESRLENYNECEFLFSHYIRMNNIESSIIVIGLKSFTMTNQDQLAKEFFLQIMKDYETFPLDPHDFRIFLEFLQRLYQFDTIDYFFQVWVQYNKPLDYELLSYVHYIYLKNHNPLNVKLERFSNKKGNIYQTGYFQSLECRITEFISSSKRNGSVDNVVKQGLDDMVEKSPVALRDWYYKKLINMYVQFHDIENIEETLGKKANDPYIVIDETTYHSIAKIFVFKGDFKNLIKYYNRLMHERTIHLQEEIFYSIFRCGKIAFPDLNFEAMVYNLRNIMNTNREDIRQLWWLNNFMNYLNKWNVKTKTSKSGTYVYNELIKCLKNDDVIRARDVLCKYFQSNGKQDYSILYGMLKYCLSKDRISLAKLIDGQLRQDNYFYRHDPLKLEIIWLIHQGKNQPSNSLSMQRANLRQFSRNFESQMTSQNMLQLTNAMISLCDFEHATSLIKKASSKINTPYQWTIFYMTSLKLAAKSLNRTLYLAILTQWYNNACPVVLVGKSRIQFRPQIKYFHKKLLGCQDDPDFILWEKNVMHYIQQLKQRDTERQAQAKRDIQFMADSIQQWIDQSILEDSTFLSH